MTAMILVEGPVEQKLLEVVLPTDILQQANLTTVGERANISSTARTLLFTRRQPIVLLLQARFRDAESLADKRQLLEELIGMASGRIPFKVIYLVPQLETLYFEASGFVTRHFGPLSREMELLAYENPRVAITELCARQNQPYDRATFLDQLDEADIEAMRQTAPLQELMQFVVDVTGAVASA